MHVYGTIFDEGWFAFLMKRVLSTDMSCVSGSQAVLSESWS